jgi:predicted CopG family antitoxin
MTVHQAKGMQWPVVFLPALLKNRFPAKRQSGRAVWHLLPAAAFHDQARYLGSLEDERRLFYVALTWGQMLLFCTSAPVPGNQLYQRVSEFLDDVRASRWVKRRRRAARSAATWLRTRREAAKAAAGGRGVHSRDEGQGHRGCCGPPERRDARTARSEAVRRLRPSPDVQRRGGRDGLRQERLPSLPGRRRSVHDPCMAVRTITVDLEAYELLARRKRPGMSFSQVIKLHLAPRRTARDLLATAKAAPLGPKALEAVEQLIRGRKASPARAPKL